MPLSSGSPAGSKSLSVTKIAARLAAGSIDVCRAGGVCALHLNTQRGIIICEIPEAAFVRGARGPVDANGNRFRTLEQIEADRPKPGIAAAHLVSGRQQQSTVGPRAL